MSNIKKINIALISFIIIAISPPSFAASASCPQPSTIQCTGNQCSAPGGWTCIQNFKILKDTYYFWGASFLTATSTVTCSYVTSGIQPGVMINLNSSAYKPAAGSSNWETTSTGQVCIQAGNLNYCPLNPS